MLQACEEFPNWKNKIYFNLQSKTLEFVESRMIILGTSLHAPSTNLEVS